VANDTAVTVVVADCNAESACRSTGELKTLDRHAKTTLSVESCNAVTLGVFHPGAVDAVPMPNRADSTCGWEACRRSDSAQRTRASEPAADD